MRAGPVTAMLLGWRADAAPRARRPAAGEARGWRASDLVRSRRANASRSLLGARASRTAPARAYAACPAARDRAGDGERAPQRHPRARAPVDGARCRAARWPGVRSCSRSDHAGPTPSSVASGPSPRGSSSRRRASHAAPPNGRRVDELRPRSAASADAGAYERSGSTHARHSPTSVPHGARTRASPRSAHAPTGTALRAA